MTREEVKQMCTRMDVPFDTDHPDHLTAENFTNLAPPFMEYTLTDRPVYADGVRYLDIMQLAITLYSDTEVSEAEDAIEAVLEEEELRWRKSREFVEEVLMWTIIYTMEV